MSYKVGVSTACLYPMLTEQALLELCKRDIKNVEIFLNAPCEMEKPFLRELKSMLGHYGVSVVSLHPFTCELETMLFFTGYPRRFKDGLEYYKRFFEVMEYLGAGIFVLHGGNKNNRFPEDMYFDRFVRFNETSAEYGVTVAHENVARCSAGDVDFMERMKTALGDKARFVLDTKQAVRAGQDPYEFVRRLGSSICHIHISDHDEQSDCMPVGMGKLDYQRFIAALEEHGVDAAIILELYSSNYGGANELSDNYIYLRDHQHYINA